MKHPRFKSLAGAAWMLAIGLCSLTGMAATAIRASADAAVDSVDGATQAVTSLRAGKMVVPLAIGTDITVALQNAITNGYDPAAGNTAQLITIPAGYFTVSGSITIPGDHAIKIQGAGKQCTTLMWNVDMGTSTYAFDANPGASFPFELCDMAVIGPNHQGATGDTTGVKPAYMSGVNAIGRAYIHDCMVAGFFAGIQINGDHEIVERCDLGNNYYGLYWKAVKLNDFDQMIEECIFANDRFACVACDPGTPIGCIFLRDHFYGSPYGFYREPEPAGWSGGHTFMEGCQLTAVQFEGQNNANIYDASGAGKIEACTWENCGGWGSRYGKGIPAANTASGIAPAVGPSMTVGTYDENITIGYGVPPYDFKAGAVFDNTWLSPGALNGLSSNAPPNVTGFCYSNVIRDGDATALLANADTKLAAGQPVEIGHFFYAENFTYKKAAGAKPVAGVALSAARASGACIIGVKGLFKVSGAGSDPAFTQGALLRLIPSGAIRTSTGAPVGYLADNSAAAGAKSLDVFVNSPEF